MTRYLFLACALLGIGSATAEEKSYERIVTLAPNLAELVFAVGAGDTLVGTSAYTDYPPAAADVQVVSDAFTVDLEQLEVLRPELILAWGGGTPTRLIDQLRGRGYAVEVIDTKSLADVAAALRRIGELTGRKEDGADVAASFEAEIEGLRQQHVEAEPIRVFYQVSAKPLYTVSGDHYASELIELCGGVNVFDDLDTLAPAVTVESVVERDPEVMITAKAGGPRAYDEWYRFPNIAAIRKQNLYFLPSDEIGRAAPRLVVAGRAICEALTVARLIVAGN